MHVIQPARYAPKPVPKRRRIWPLFILALMVIGLLTNYFRPLPSPTASVNIPLPPSQSAPMLAWPEGLQASVGAEGFGLLATHGPQTPLATASIAKVILALCVLQKAPLKVGETGPTYVVTADDVAIYNTYLNNNGSLIRVVEGEKLTEYQTLVALMLPSANNIADSLVGWVFGSQSEYQTFATNFLKVNGINNTVIGDDASGYSETTTSTASDLTAVGLLALKNPVLMEIANQQTAELPVEGTVQNYDTILGRNGITGLKTGNNDANPGAFLFTADGKVGERNVKLTGAVMGADNLQMALDASVELVGSLPTGFENLRVLSKDQVVGAVTTEWGDSVPIKSKKDLDVLRYKTTPLHETHRLQTGVQNGTIGSVQVRAGETNDTTALQLTKSVEGPSLWWRLTRH